MSKKQAAAVAATNVCLGMSLVLVTAVSADASTILFNNSSEFFATVGSTTRYAVSNVPTLSGFAGLPFGFDDGSFPFAFNGASFELQASSGFNPLSTGDFSSRYPGNELAVQGQEGLNAIAYGVCGPSGECIPTPTFFSFGFNFVEPEHDSGAALGPDSGAPFVDSLYQVMLFNLQGIAIGGFTFNVPNDAASFVGVWSTDAIRQVTIRELTADSGDEFFGDFFVGSGPQPPAGVPEPSTIVYLATGFLGVAWRRLHPKRPPRGAQARA